MQWFEPDHDNRHTTAPDFRLTALNGGAVTRAQFRGNYHLVLVFWQESGAGDKTTVLDGLAAALDELMLANARLFIISPRALTLNPALSVLVDADNAVRAQYAALFPEDQIPSGTELFLVILNRYGVLEFAGRALGDGDAEDIVKAIVTRVWSLEYQCSL